MNKDNNPKISLEKIRKTLDGFSLPSWDELPGIYLYMDQVIELTTSYFDEISAFMGDEKILTAPMINNYIKLKAMPAPEKKRYGKIHLAYLIMISSLKQRMNISSMEAVIPLLDNEEEIKRMYTDFVQNQKKALGCLGSVLAPIIETAPAKEEPSRDVVLQIILASSLMKIFTSGLTFVSSKTDEKEKDEEPKNSKPKKVKKSEDRESKENED